MERIDGTPGRPAGQKIVGLAYSKLRNELGLVGVEVDVIKRNIIVKLARQWPSDDAVRMIGDVQAYYIKNRWDKFYVDQGVGEYLITTLKRAGMGIRVMNTQKKVREGKKLRAAKTMDIIEMTEFLATLQRNRQLRFVRTPSRSMRELENQMPLFSKHATEAGGIDFYASGTEPDNLVRALLIACFGGRKLLLWRHHTQIRSKKILPSTIDDRGADLGTALQPHQTSMGRHVDWPSGGSKNPPKYRIR